MESIKIIHIIRFLRLRLSIRFLRLRLNRNASRDKHKFEESTTSCNFISILPPELLGIIDRMIPEDTLITVRTLSTIDTTMIRCLYLAIPYINRLYVLESRTVCTA